MPLADAPVEWIGVALGSPVMRCSDPKSQTGWTPLAATTEAQLLPERADDIYRIVGMRPSYVFTYEGTELREHIADLGVKAANPHLMAESVGPDGRPALTYHKYAFHYTTDAGVIPFQGAGFAITMVCKLDGTAGRLLSEWNNADQNGFRLDYLASGFLRLTAGSPDAETTCQLYVGDQVGSWSAITLAIQRIAGRWRCVLATPTASHANQLGGGDFTPAARLHINRRGSDDGTAMACRWLAIFEGAQVGDHDIRHWHNFTATIARAARAH